MKKFVIVITVLLGSFFVGDLARAAILSSADVVINEVAWMGTTNSASDEWIELKNNTATDLNLSGWRLEWNHGSVSSSVELSGTIAAGNYFLLERTGDDSVPEIAADQIYTGALSNSGEMMTLSDADGATIDYFDCAFNTPAGWFAGSSTARLTMSRVDAWASGDVANNWRDSAVSSGTPRAENVWVFVSTTPTSTPEEGGGEADVIISTATLWAQLKLNEIVSAPPEGVNEWVEIYNPATSSLDLTGGYICDSTGGGCKPAIGTIAGGGWLVVDLKTDRYLNNATDTVALINPDGMNIDRVEYGTAAMAAPINGQSLARFPDGAGDWQITIGLTAGAGNVINAPVVLSPPSGGGGGGNQAPVPALEIAPLTTASSSAPVTSSWFGLIVINELWPDPPGDDEEEFIEIKNLSSSTVNLSGWKLADKTRAFVLSGELPAGAIKVFDREITGISLNNATPEEVKLSDKTGALADKASYEKAGGNDSYSRADSGERVWRQEITRGEENKIENEIKTESKSAADKDGGLLWKIKYSPRTRAGAPTTFDAALSLDKRGGELSFAWDLGEGAPALTGPIVSYIFVSSGLHDITLFATSTAGSAARKNLQVMVYPLDKLTGAGVIIAEIMPDPPGADEREYVKILNITTGTINVSNWQLLYNDKLYQIPTSTFIAGQAALTFYQAITNFTLNNGGGRLELRLPDNVLADAVEYGLSKEGQPMVFGAGTSTTMIIYATKTPAPVKTAAVKAAGSVAAANLAQLRATPNDYFARARGIVTALPGTFGVQYFYLSDESGGAQVYQYKKDFPPLNLGDRVAVAGILSEASGVKRLKLKSAADVDILSTDKVLPALKLGASELNDDYLGMLVEIIGEITEIKTNFMYVDDGAGEALVYFKNGTGINKKLFAEGETVAVTGIVERSKENLQLWPRFQADIVSLGFISEHLAGAPAPAASGDHAYATATAGGATALILGWLARARGALLLGGIKKAASLAARVVRKG